MPFFLDGNPTQGEISEAVNYLLGNTQLTTSTNIVNGQVTDASGTTLLILAEVLRSYDRVNDKVSNVMSQ